MTSNPTLPPAIALLARDDEHMNRFHGLPQPRPLIMTSVSILPQEDALGGQNVEPSFLRLPPPRPLILTSIPALSPTAAPKVQNNDPGNVVVDIPFQGLPPPRQLIVPQIQDDGLLHKVSTYLSTLPAPSGSHSVEEEAQRGFSPLHSRETVGLHTGEDGVWRTDSSLQWPGTTGSHAEEDGARLTSLPSPLRVSVEARDTPLCVSSTSDTQAKQGRLCPWSFEGQEATLKRVKLEKLQDDASLSTAPKDPVNPPPGPSPLGGFSSQERVEISSTGNKEHVTPMLTLNSVAQVGAGGSYMNSKSKETELSAGLPHAGIVNTISCKEEFASQSGYHKETLQLQPSLLRKILKDGETKGSGSGSPSCNTAGTSSSAPPSAQISPRRDVLTCGLCNKVFSEEVLLGFHWKMEHKDEARLFQKGVACQACGSEYSRRENLRRHVTSRHPSMTVSSLCSVVCVMCGEKFPDFYRLWTHVEEKHLLELSSANIARQVREGILGARSLLNCSICWQEFNFDWDLQYHTESVHKSQIDQDVNLTTELPIVGDGTAESAHKDIATSTRKFKCRFCGRKFNLLPDLGRHHKAEHRKVTVSSPAVGSSVKKVPSASEGPTFVSPKPVSMFSGALGELCTSPSFERRMQNKDPKDSDASANAIKIVDQSIKISSPVTKRKLEGFVSPMKHMQRGCVKREERGDPVEMDSAGPLHNAAVLSGSETASAQIQANRDILICALCKTKFSKMALLGNHWKEAHKKEALLFRKGFACQECGREYSNRANLYKHWSSRHPSVSRINPCTIVCVMCEDNFKDFDLLWSHVEDKHSLVFSSIDIAQQVRKGVLAARSLLKCSFCGEEFGTDLDLHQHMESSHKGQLGQDSNCDTELPIAEGRIAGIAHSDRAISTSKFKCRFCGKRFNLLPDLGRHHMAEHKKPNSKPFK